MSNQVAHANGANYSPIPSTMTVASDSPTCCVAGATHCSVTPSNTVDYASSAWACSAIFVPDPTTVAACPRLQRFVSPRSAIRHCRGGPLTIIHRCPGSSQAWLSARTTQSCGRISVSRQLASLSRRHCNALCSTVDIALAIRKSRLIWHSSSVPIGGKVSARTLPDGQSRVKLVKKLRCTNTPKPRSSDCQHRPSDSVIYMWI